MSNGHKRNINTTDWQTIENINNRQQNLPPRYKQDNPCVYLVKINWICHLSLIDIKVLEEHKNCCSCIPS